MNLDILKKTPTKREKILFYIYIAGFFIVLFRSCAIPSFSLLSSLEIKLNLVESERYSLQEKAMLKTSKNKTPKKEEPESDEINYFTKKAKFSYGLDDSALLNYFSNEDIKKGVEITDFSLTENPAFKGLNVKQKNISFTINGPFTKVGAYMERIESLPLFVIFDKILITVVDDKFFRVSAKISGNIYGVEN